MMTALFSEGQSLGGAEFRTGRVSDGQTRQMLVLVWVTPRSWVSCVEAAQSLSPEATITLAAVVDTGPAGAAHGAYGGLLGRGGDDPASRMAEVARQEAQDMLDAAADRLGRPARRLLLEGHAEQAVMDAAQDASLLVVARDGHSHGPKSLGKEVRFVIDHVACAVLLIWPASYWAAP
jgi:hypothetical protein